MADINDYGVAGSEEILQQQRDFKNQSFSTKSKIGYITLAQGANVIRIAPAHKNSLKRSNFWVPKCGSWIPQEVWMDSAKKEAYGTKEEIEERAKKGEISKGIKNKFIFNSRIHGTVKKDLVEEYILFSQKHLKEESLGVTDIKAKKAIDDKIAALTHWQSGIQPKNSWVLYGWKHFSDGKKQLGKLEITPTLKEGVNSLSIREEAGRAIVVDVFTHPVTGKAIQIYHDETQKRKVDWNKPSLLWDKEWPLTIEDLDELEAAPSLEDLFINSFKRNDFIKQLQGLEIFDAEKRIGTFRFDNWFTIVDEIGNWFPETTEEEQPSAPVIQNTSPPPVQQLLPPSDLLNHYKKEDMIVLIKEKNLPLIPRPTHTDEKLRENVREVILEALGLPEYNAEAINNYLKVYEEGRRKPEPTPPPTITHQPTPPTQTGGDDAIAKLRDKYKNL